MSIKQLKPDLITQIRSSSSAINTISSCVNELVFNSLDAKATAIAIRINLSTFRIQVVDNGIGISKSDFELIGLEYATRKCESRKQLCETRLKTYGYRGTSLYNISKLCTFLDITSKSRNATQTFRKILNRTKAVFLSKANRASCGTTVTVHCFLHNLPVRRNRIKVEFELESLKTQLRLVSLINPNVSFSLRNDLDGRILLDIRKHSDVIDAVSQYNASEVERKDFTILKVAKHQIKIEALFCMNTIGGKRFQFVYANKRPIVSKKLNKFIKALVKSKSKQLSWIINIKGPCFGMYFTAVTHNKLGVEFANWNRVLHCVSKLFVTYLKGDVTEKKRENLKMAPVFRPPGLSGVYGAVKGRVAYKRKSNSPVELISEDKRSKTSEEVAADVDVALLEPIVEIQEGVSKNAPDLPDAKQLIMDMFLKSTLVYDRPVLTILESNFQVEKNVQTDKKTIFNTTKTTMSVKFKVNRKRPKNFELDESFRLPTSVYFGGDKTMDTFKETCFPFDFPKELFAKKLAQPQINETIGGFKRKFLANTNLLTERDCSSKDQFKKSFFKRPKELKVERNEVKNCAPKEVEGFKKFFGPVLKSCLKRNVNVKEIKKSNEDMLMEKDNYQVNQKKSKLLVQESNELNPKNTRGFVSILEKCPNKRRFNFNDQKYSENILPPIRNELDFKKLQSTNFTLGSSYINLQKEVEEPITENFEFREAEISSNFTLDASFLNLKNTNGKIFEHNLKSQPNICDSPVKNATKEMKKLLTSEFLHPVFSQEAKSKDGGRKLNFAPKLRSPQSTRFNLDGTSFLHLGINPVESIGKSNEYLPETKRNKLLQQFKKSFDGKKNSSDKETMKEQFFGDEINLGGFVPSEEPKKPFNKINTKVEENSKQITQNLQCTNFPFPSLFNKEKCAPQKKKRSRLSLLTPKKPSQPKDEEKIENPIEKTKLKTPNEITNILLSPNFTLGSSFPNLSKIEDKPKEARKFELKLRSDFIPKGQSPIIKTPKDLLKPISQNSKNKLQKGLLDSYANELLCIKWGHYMQDNCDLKSFFTDLYKDETKLYQSDIPNICTNKLPKYLRETSINKMCFNSADLFKNLKLIGQFDCKFIAVIKQPENYLIIFDQHAVHERIRVEDLIKKYKGAKVKLKRKLSLNLEQDQLEMLQSVERSLKEDGFDLEYFSGGLNVQEIPLVLHRKFKSDKNVDLPKLVQLLIEDVIENVCATGVYKSPEFLQGLVNSEACRGAIKFGQLLNYDECTKLLEDLSRCNLPFQCAHGRPTLCTLVQLKNTKEKLQKNKANLKKLRV